MPIVDPQTKSINQAYLLDPTSQLVDLSTNLYGIFTLSDGEIQIVGKKQAYYTEYCRPNDTVEVPLYRQDFIKIKDRDFWFIKIKPLQDIEVKYPGAKNSPSFVAQCHVSHTPMRWNYWHYSIRWYIEPQNENAFWLHEIPASPRRRYIKKIATELRSILAINASIVLDNEFEIISPSDYLIFPSSSQ